MRATTRAALMALLAAGLAAAPASADEFTDTVEGALAAYRSGDLDGAAEDLEFATKLINEMKASSLGQYLPEAMAGWTKTETNDPEGAGAAMAMFGGGAASAATYTRGADELTITLIAHSPMVSGIGAMVSGLSTFAGGKPVRIARTEFAVTDGNMQGVIDGKVLVSVTGSAPIEAKTAYLEAMDFDALADF